MVWKLHSTHWVPLLTLRIFNLVKPLFVAIQINPSWRSSFECDDQKIKVQPFTVNELILIDTVHILLTKHARSTDPTKAHMKPEENANQQLQNTRKIRLNVKTLRSFFVELFCCDLRHDTGSLSLSRSINSIDTPNPYMLPSETKLSTCIIKVHAIQSRLQPYQHM